MANDTNSDGQPKKLEHEEFDLQTNEIASSYAIAEPPSHYQAGKDAALTNQPRVAPVGLSDDQADAWYYGWDNDGTDDQ